MTDDEALAVLKDAARYAQKDGDAETWVAELRQAHAHLTRRLAAAQEMAEVLTETIPHMMDCEISLDDEFGSCSLRLNSPIEEFSQAVQKATSVITIWQQSEKEDGE